MDEKTSAYMALHTAACYLRDITDAEPGEGMAWRADLAYVHLVNIYAELTGLTPDQADELITGYIRDHGVPR